MRLPSLLTLTVAAALGLAALAAGPVGAQDEVDETELLLARINAMRLAHSLAALERHEGLDAAALEHSADMAAHGELVHVSDRTGDPGARVGRAGVAVARLTQNIARGATPMEAHRSILSSDPHREQLMDPEATHIGLAAVPGDDGVYLTQVIARIDAEALEAEPPPPAPVEAAPEPAPEQDEPPPAPEVVELPRDEPASEPSGEVVDEPLPEAAVVQPRASSQGVPEIRVPAARPGVAGYWVHWSGRWWYYPVPANAQPGQQLAPDPNVQGPPPGYAAAPTQPRTTVVVTSSAPAYYAYPTYYTYPAPRPVVRPSVGFRVGIGPGIRYRTSPRRRVIVYRRR